MNLTELFNKSEAELKKINKDDIIKSIISNKYTHEYNERRIKELDAELKLSKAPYDQAKHLLLGATGYDASLNEYTKKPDLNDIDLCFLVGLLLSQRKED